MSNKQIKKDNTQITNRNIPLEQGITSIHVKQTSIFSPEVAEHYQRLVPRAAERILVQFEKNSETKRNIDVKPFEESKRKDWMGYSLLVGLLGVSVVSGIHQLDILSYSSLALFAGLILKAFFHKQKK